MLIRATVVHVSHRQGSSERIIQLCARLALSSVHVDFPRDNALLCLFQIAPEARCLEHELAIGSFRCQDIIDVGRLAS